ncbi:MAG TPA: IS1380 family transposase [Desulfosporosinus sp.]|nr:IS1380 family transposase [Desulfosporosinus sp.]
MKFIIEQSDEMLTTHSGLALVGLLLKKTDINDRLNQLKIDKVISPEISNRDIVAAYTGLLCQGKSCYDHIEPFRRDLFFRQSLDMKSVPSSSTLRQRLQLLGVTTDTDKVILEESVKLIKTVKAPLTPIVLPAIKDNEQNIVFPERHLIPCDADVSCMDNSKTKKEGVSRTYHGYDGFSPMFAYIGLEGYALNGELRDGKTHCQNGTPEFLEESIRLARLITDSPLLFRLDSGNDSIDNILKFTNREDYIIKRNLRKESPEKWLDIAKQQVEAKTGTCVKAREGKNVYYGRMSIKRKELAEPLSVAYKVSERMVYNHAILSFSLFDRYQPSAHIFHGMSGNCENFVLLQVTA